MSEIQLDGNPDAIWLRPTTITSTYQKKKWAKPKRGVARHLRHLMGSPTSPCNKPCKRCGKPVNIGDWFVLGRHNSHKSRIVKTGAKQTIPVSIVYHESCYLDGRGKPLAVRETIE